MGTIKDRNDKDLPEAEEIKKRWREYTEELRKRSFSIHEDLLQTQIIMMVSSLT